MNVHYAVPDLFWPEPAGAPAAHRDDRLPAIEQLIARGRRSQGTEATLESWLLSQWGVPDAAVAPYCLLADGGRPGTDAWLRADPCHYRVGRDHAVLVDATMFDLPREEADALVQSLNGHFARAGFTFDALLPERWYARFGAAADLGAPSLAAARGRPVEGRPATGRARWHALANEMQMLLHAHPVNEAREARGEPAINAVWLWGGGTFVAPTRKPFPRVRSSDPLAAGLAIASSASVLPLPAESAQSPHDSASGGVELVVLDELRAPAAYGDATTWHDRVKRLDRDWFAPALAALRARGIGMFTLHALGSGGTLDVETTRQDLRCFWRRPRPLPAYAAPAEHG